MYCSLISHVSLRACCFCFKVQYSTDNIRSTSRVLQEVLSEYFSKHRYDIKSRPDNSKLAKQFQDNHDINDNLNVTILQNNIKNAAAQKYHEGKWVCRPKPLALDRLNIEAGDCAKEMYKV